MIILWWGREWRLQTTLMTKFHNIMWPTYFHTTSNLFTSGNRANSSEHNFWMSYLLAVIVLKGNQWHLIRLWEHNKCLLFPLLFFVNPIDVCVKQCTVKSFKSQKFALFLCITVALIWLVSIQILLGIHCLETACLNCCQPEYNGYLHNDSLRRIHVFV